MADETQPLIEQERTYDPTSDVYISTDQAFDVYREYVEDLLAREAIDVVRIEDSEICKICVKLTECTETRTLPKLLKKDKVSLFSMFMAASPPTSNTVFNIEDGFQVPEQYRPDRPDVKYIESLFRPEDTPEFTNGFGGMKTTFTPTESSLRELEKSDNYQLGEISYNGSGTYTISVRWLGDDADS